MKRIRRLDKGHDFYSVREICREDKYSNKIIILDFYIKTNNIEESKIKVLIDYGSDINCIYPEIKKKIKINKLFNVSGLVYGIPTVNKATEKCILPSKNY